MVERLVGASRGGSNCLLALLPRRTRTAFEARCTRTELAFGQVLAQPDARIRYVYFFPIDSLVSLIAHADAGSTLEVGLIGNEGMFGATIALGSESAPLHALVQGDGTALGMTAAQFRHEL